MTTHEEVGTQSSRDGATWGPKGAMAPAGSKKKRAKVVKKN